MEMEAKRKRYAVQVRAQVYINLLSPPVHS